MQLERWANFITAREDLVSTSNITSHPRGEAIIEVLFRVAEREYEEDDRLVQRACTGEEIETEAPTL